MLKVAVLDTNKNVLEPCHPAVARRLLKRGLAAVWRRVPFTIILKKSVPVEQIVTGDYTLRWSPGSKVSGLAITDSESDVVMAADLHHQGGQITSALGTRSGFRRGRRTRNVRYRQARWSNRGRNVPVLTESGWTYRSAEVAEGADDSQKNNTFNRVSWAQLRDPRYEWERLSTKPKPNPHLTRKDRRAMHANDKKVSIPQKKRWRRKRIEHKKRARNGWIAPSLMSRVFNLETWTRRLCAVYPITELAIMHVKFDMQLMENPDIHGIEYQQGTLYGYEIRAYLLELTNRKCAYCGKGGRPLQVDHIYPKSKGGSSRPDNLTMACYVCNHKKDNLVGAELEEKCGTEFSKKVEAALRKSKRGLKDAAAVNTIRWKLYETLAATGLPVACETGGSMAHNRNKSGLPKTHYYDAASVGCMPNQPVNLNVNVITAIGYGRRDNIGKKFLMKAPGFVLPSEKRAESGGFRKFDHVELRKKNGEVYRGYLNCFGKTPKGKPRNCRVKYFDPEAKDPRKSGNTSLLRLLQRRDGYFYGRVSAATNFREKTSIS